MKIMWKLSVTVTLLSCLWTTVQAEFTIIPSNEVGAYYYPAPPQAQRLYDPVSAGREPVFPTSQSYHYQYQNQHSYQTFKQSSYGAKQFASPAVDTVPFNLALGNQGYARVNQLPEFNAAFRAIPRSRKPVFQAPAKPTSTSSPKSTSSSPPSASTIGSLNVKLPLPVGNSPINIAPLPLQSGAPYAAIPRGVTSYGTLYPQRRRR